MKKHLLKLAILVLLLTLPTIKNTNSYYSDEKKIVANSMSTGYWIVDSTSPLPVSLTVTGSWSKTVDEKITNSWTTAGDVSFDSGTVLIGKTSGDEGKQVWENRLMQSFNSGVKTLSFDYNFFTTDGGSHDDPGFFARLNGQQIFATGAASINPENAFGLTFSSGWKTFSYDLSNYSDGQKLNLALYAGNTGGTFDQSWVYIDKVTTTFVAAPSHAIFHLTGSDNPGGSGIKRFQYKIDGASEWTTGDSFKIETTPIEGPHTLTYRSQDNAGNYGPESVTKIITDDTSPSKITDLGVTVATNSATLIWTAPGNDGNVGRASSYDVRYSTSSIVSDADFTGATKVDKVPAPKESGQIESLEILGLNPATKYYFAIKSSDEAPNTSDLSSVVSATTDSGVDLNPGDLVINEVVWGGPDQFIELRNITDRVIDLSGLKLFKDGADLGIDFSGKSISPHGYYVVNGTFIDGIFELELVKDGESIDVAGDGIQVFAGDETHSMERTTVPGMGSNPMSWYTCLEGNTRGVENRSENEPIPVKTIIATPSATIINDGKSVSFKIINLGGFEKLSYVLTYDSDQAPQGIQGMAELQGVDGFEKTGILLGTCSTGGTCTYNTGVKNISLKVELTDSLGKITMLEGGENE